MSMKLKAEWTWRYTQRKYMSNQHRERSFTIERSMKLKMRLIGCMERVHSGLKREKIMQR